MGLESKAKYARLMLMEWEGKMPKNLIVYYLYRDASNYKQHGSVVVANDAGIEPDALYAAIKAAFSHLDIFPDVVAFDPSALGWPSLFFEDYDLAGDDVLLHELEAIHEAYEAPTIKVSSYELICALNILVGKAKCAPPV